MTSNGSALEFGTSAIEARGYGAVDAGLADIAQRLASLERSRSLLAGE